MPTIPPFFPDLNMVVPFWRDGHLPSAVPADGTFQGQFYTYSRQVFGLDLSLTTVYVPTVVVRTGLAAITSLGAHPTQCIFARQQLFSLHVYYYQAVWWDSVHVGFPNEYLEFTCVQCDSNGSVPTTDR